MRRVILKSFQSPGDIVMLTAAIRDLHLAHPGEFQTDIRTTADSLFENNPHVTQLEEHAEGVESIDMHYPLIHNSNERPYHFQHGYTQFLEQTLNLKIPLTRFGGAIHLSEDERATLPEVAVENGVRPGFWIIVAGGKYDFTAKWWNPRGYQQVVHEFEDRIQFVQCGSDEHWHPRLEGAVDLVGKTSIREFVWLMHHAAGVVCPVTFAMHLAAAVEPKRGARPLRPCVVVAGGREPPHWEAYPGHQFIHTIGSLPCCSHGGCWKSRCQKVGDGDRKDIHDLCESPVQIEDDLQIPQCMEMIKPADVIRKIEFYLQTPDSTTNGSRGRTKRGLNNVETNGNVTKHEPPANGAESKPADAKETISVSFFHGLGDCVYFAHLIPLYTRRGFEVEVECTPDKSIVFEAAGARVIEKGAKASHPWAYPSRETFNGHGRYWQGSKLAHNISEAPLPDIGSREELWNEYCNVRLPIDEHIPDKTHNKVHGWLEGLPKPVVLLHSKGNSGQERKSLPDEIVRELYFSLLDRFSGSLILLDWDNRVPRLASYRVRHLSDLGSCDTASMLSLMSQADLMIGVDSGPLHAARFTRTPTVGVWMPGHYPSTYTLPRIEQLNIVLTKHTQQWNRWKRIPWNLVEHPGSGFNAEILADWCTRMLRPARYLSDACRAGDLQLEQLVRQWSRSSIPNGLSDYIDRHLSFDLLLREIRKRFIDGVDDDSRRPSIVETGTIRSEDDWGAGFFTYIVGSFLHRHGRGKLDSCDINPANCNFAKEWTQQFDDGQRVAIHNLDSLQYLASRSDPIDVLYLDSLDTTEPGHAQHALKEIQLAMPRLHRRSLVLIDDTTWQGGAWIGKGATAVPWLLEQGWSIAYAGYQVLLSREPVEAEARP